MECLPGHKHWHVLEPVDENRPGGKARGECKFCGDIEYRTPSWVEPKRWHKQSPAKNWMGKFV